MSNRQLAFILFIIIVSIMLPIILFLRFMSSKDSLFGKPIDDIIATVPSPDGKFVALVIERDAGSTTSNVRFVAVIKSSQSKDKLDEGKVFLVEGTPNIAVVWNSSNTITVNCDKGRVFYMSKQKDGITVKYKLSKGVVIDR